MNILVWTAIAGWLAPIPIVLIGGVVLRLSPWLRSKLFGK